MNLTKVSYKLLEEAVTKGTMTLENGTLYEINTSQLITILKFLTGNVPSIPDIDKEEGNIPEEMLLPFPPIIVCYRCHKQYPDSTTFYSSPDDPLAQVCAGCKEIK